MERLVCKSTPCFLASFFFPPCLMRAFTSALWVGFPSALVILHTSRFGMKYEIAFLSIANVFALLVQKLDCISFQLCCPKPLQIHIPQHIILSNSSQHFHCMHMITRILTFQWDNCGTNDMNEARIHFVLEQSFSCFTIISNAVLLFCRV